jgi:hypothetical protein
MKRVFEMCFAALALATAASPAEGSSFAGTWEGQIGGIKAVTLDIQDAGAMVAGSATFYVIKNEGEGKRIGGATRVAMEHVRFHDEVLEFEVTVSTGGDAVHFRLTLNGRNTAELKRAAKGDMPELTVSLRRQMQL